MKNILVAGAGHIGSMIGELLVSTGDRAHHEDHRDDQRGSPLEGHQHGSLSHGCGRGNSHDAEPSSPVRLNARARRADREPERYVDHRRGT